MKEQDKVKARVVTHSVSSAGQEVVTIEHESPRINHSEFLRHRQFSNCVASSRAIPCKTMRKNIRANMFIPWYWGKEESGMQATEEVGKLAQKVLRVSWKLNANVNLFFSWWYEKLGLHKQLANRNTEYISYIKVCTTTTSLVNFMNLRDDDAAQPEIRELAVKMREAVDASKPTKLGVGQWHLPYVPSTIKNGVQFFEGDLSLREAKLVSASCVAQTSYRTTDTSLAKAMRITKNLMTSSPPHASPFEAVLTPYAFGQIGVTAYTLQGVPLSGNSSGWIQYRHLLT